MKLFTFILNLFSKRKTYSTLFSEALAEGVKESSKEMGYDFKDASGSADDKTSKAT